MKKTLSFLKQLYQRVSLEIQYLIYTTTDGDIKYYKISEDVSDEATNSSFNRFKAAAAKVIQDNGVNVFIVHNHPKSSPKPSYMDYQNKDLINSWATVCGIKITDYLIVSEKGYYSFSESKELGITTVDRQKADLYESSFDISQLNITNVLREKDKINHILKSYDELLIAGNKIFYSSCLPLEYIKKEVENEEVKLILFLKNKPNVEETFNVINCFLRPMVMIEVMPNGNWETIM